LAQTCKGKKNVIAGLTERCAENSGLSSTEISIKNDILKKKKYDRYTLNNNVDFDQNN
jgi:hypothetical protein